MLNMMIRRLRAGFFCVLIAILILGCSFGKSSPTIPRTAEEHHSSGFVQEEDSQGHLLWAIFDVTWDGTANGINVHPLRFSDNTFNILRFLVPRDGSPANIDFNVADTSRFQSDGIVSLDVSITHPSTDTAMTVFDVMGLVIGDGAIGSRYDPTLRYAGPDDLMILNADGYINWSIPAESTTDGKTVTDGAGSIPDGSTAGDDLTEEGLFRQGDSSSPISNQDSQNLPPVYSRNTTATANGYKYFAEGIDPVEGVKAYFLNSANVANRGTFLPGSTITRRYDLQLPASGRTREVNFQYAVLAHWKRAVDEGGNPVTEPAINDFHENANRTDPVILDCDASYRIADCDCENNNMAEVVLVLTIADWQAPLGSTGVIDRISEIIVELPTWMIPDGFSVFTSQFLYDAEVSSGPYFTRLKLTIPDVTPTSMGEDIFISLLTYHEALNTSHFRCPVQLNDSSSISAVSSQLVMSYELDLGEFKETLIGNLIVRWQQQTISNDEYTAIVEKAQIVYHFNSAGELLKKIDTFNYNLPIELPKVISKEQAESLVTGEIQFSNLYYISSESDVFPIEPTPNNPCWILRTTDNNGFGIVLIIDAVTGSFLGNGVPPPYTGFSLSGPQYWNPCSGVWSSWYQNAEMWFEVMGYPTDGIVWPTQAQVQSHIQDNNNTLFYELAHGGSYVFQNGCVGGNTAEATYASEIESWIAGYDKKQFTFIGSCGGMCSTIDNTLSYEFRKGSYTDTTTVGYCDMAEAKCSTCWNYSVQWQNELFYHMSQGSTVKVAFDAADAAYPSCASSTCMRFAGDTSFAIDTTYGLPCGFTMKEDLILKQDIMNCPDCGLFIWNNNITLDCDGYTIDGLGDSSGTGVHIWGRTGITIKNCNIQEFSDGITLWGGSGNEIISNILSNNWNGIYLYNNTTSNTFWDNEFVGNENYNVLEYSYGNNWDYYDGGIGEDVGNYWDDFAGHDGWPYTYVIDGPGDGIDHDPVGGAGYLCNADMDCASGLFCAGSENHPSRCGENPTSDGWYGGGDIQGCGDDPDSEYRDYYFDSNGQEQYEVTDTLNCDEYDDCEPPEITDYFVIENTNICDYKTWQETDPNVPILTSPTDEYEYKVGDDLFFSWKPGEGSNDTYYFNATHNGAPFVTDLPYSGLTLFLPAIFIENEADDGVWEWWVSNGPNGYQCSEHRTIIKETKPTLLSPLHGGNVTPSTIFTWSFVPYAKNYVAKVKGPGLNFPPYYAFYIPLGNYQEFHMDQFIYDFLQSEGVYTWSIAAVSNTNPSIDEIMKYEYPDPWEFYKP